MRKSLTPQQVAEVQDRPEVGVRELARQFGCSPATVSRVRAGKRQYAPARNGGPMPNSYTTGLDATAYLRSLTAHRVPVGAVVCSPPYNLGLRQRDDTHNRKWQRPRLETESYGDAGDDNLPASEYIRQQRQFLDAALELVGGPQGDGVVVYQTKPLHRNQMLDDRHQILAGFPVRDIVIWDRGSTPNQDASFCPPVHEFVVFIAGRKWRWQGEGAAQKRKWTSVWRVNPETGRNPHPAPYPLELARRMCLASNGRGVADPYAGSGTTGIACWRLGLPYYLSDLSAQWQPLFDQRLAAETAQPRFA